MYWKPGKHLAFGAMALLSAAALAPSAHAEDFLSALFGSFAQRAAPPSTPLPFANEGDPSAPQQTESVENTGASICRNAIVVHRLVRYCAAVHNRC